jgi:hypothetical protein
LFLAFFDQFIDFWDLRTLVAGTLPAIVPVRTAWAIATSIITVARISAAPPGAARIASHVVSFSSCHAAALHLDP